VTGACYLVVCLYVCNCQRVSVREHISETVRPIFANLHVTYMAVACSSTGGVAICYVLPVL